MGDLSRFLKKNKKTKENIKIPATMSLTDENGTPLLWEVKPITTKEDNAIREACTVDVPVTGKPGMFRPKFDGNKYLAKMAASCIVFPNLNDKELQDSYGVMGAEQLITEMIDEGITINVLNLGILSNDLVNTLLRNVLLSFAQFERDMIVQRTQEGKAVARATDPDFREGRPPKFDTEQLDHAMELLENHSYTQVVKLTGISKSTLIRERKRRKNF